MTDLTTTPGEEELPERSLAEADAVPAAAPPQDEPELPPPPVTSPDTTLSLPRAEEEWAGGSTVRTTTRPGPKRHRLRTSPRRTLLVALCALGAAAATPLLGLVAARTIANSHEGRAVDAGPPLRELPDTPAALLVGTDASGKPASLTLFSIAADGRGGTVLVVPLATAAYIDGPAKPVPLTQAWTRGGLAGQTNGVESVLGISTSTSQQLDEDGLTALFEPYTPVDVTLDTPVLDTNPDGTTVQLFAAGDVTLSARAAARLLLARVDGESELARLPRMQALWSAIVAHAAKAPDASSVTSSAASSSSAAVAPPSDIAGYLATIAGAKATVDELRVQPSFDPSNPTAPELLQADVAYLRLLVATVMPGAVSPSNGNLSFRIVNPLGDANYAYRAIGRLAAVQANVVLVTDTTGPAPAQTTVEWNSPTGEVQVSGFATLLGAGTPVASDERIDGVDATIVLGADFPAFLDAEDAMTAATSTTEEPTTVPSPTTTNRRVKG